MSTPTIRSLVDEVVDAWRDWYDENPNGDRNGFLDETVSNAVPSMTTTLFAMVVEDNSIAFIDGPEETVEPFRCLSRAIGQEVTRLASETISGLIEEGTQDGDA